MTTTQPTDWSSNNAETPNQYYLGAALRQGFTVFEYQCRRHIVCINGETGEPIYNETRRRVRCHRFENGQRVGALLSIRTNELVIPVDNREALREAGKAARRYLEEHGDDTPASDE